MVVTHHIGSEHEKLCIISLKRRELYVEETCLAHRPTATAFLLAARVRSAFVLRLLSALRPPAPCALSAWRLTACLDRRDGRRRTLASVHFRVEGRAVLPSFLPHFLLGFLPLRLNNGHSFCMTMSERRRQ